MIPAEMLEQIRAAQRKKFGVEGTEDSGQILLPKESDYKFGKIDPSNFQSYTKLRDLILGKGPTESAQYSLKQNLLNRQNMIDAASKQGAGAMAQARSALATRGGLGAGSAERLAQSGMNQNIMAKQGAYREAGSDMFDILGRDASQKQGMLTNLTQMDISQGNVNRQTELDRYKMNLDKWAANRQASAAERAAATGAFQGGGGVSVICTELYKQGKISRREWLSATNYGRGLSPEIFSGYLTIASPIVKLMQKSNKFSNLFINWAKALAKGEPNTITKILMPVAYLIGSLQLKAQEV
jgi:hypothetical protein